MNVWQRNSLCLILTLLIVPCTLAITETMLMQDPPVDYASYGYSVDAESNRVVVGSNWDSTFGLYTGSAHVYETDGATWTLMQTLSPADPADLMWFGNAVSIDGDYIAVGAIGAGNDKGAVYIFFYNGTEWTQVKKLEAGDGEAGDFFGFAVDLNGMEVVVGAYWDSPNGEHSGSAYQFCGGCGGWQEEGRFIPADGHAEAEFGSAVAIREHHIVIGAPLHSASGATLDGKLYYYWKDEKQKAWELVQEIDSPYTNARFGHSVSIDGIYGPPFSDMRLIVGAPDYQNSDGAINLYQNTKGTWDHVDELISDYLPGVKTDFGWTVDLDNMGNVIVGMPSYNAAGNNAGAAALYYLADNQLVSHELLESADAEEGDNLGFNVAIANDVAFAGAYLKSTDTVSQCGAVCVFDDLALPTPVPTVTPTPDPATATPTVTPTPMPTTGVDVEMPAAMFATGDTCSCTVTVTYAEAEAATGLPLFVILDVAGYMYFAPDFSDFSHYTMDLNPGDVQDVIVLPEFNWPAGTGSADSIFWYAGMTNPEMSGLLGEMDIFEFGWSE